MYKNNAICTTRILSVSLWHKTHITYKSVFSLASLALCYARPDHVVKIILFLVKYKEYLRVFVIVSKYNGQENVGKQVKVIMFYTSCFLLN